MTELRSDLLGPVSTFFDTGEEHVIRQALRVLPNPNRWCVEFGAWDGIRLSNTRRLILEENYSAVLIEDNKARFTELVENYRSNPRVKPLNNYVGFTKDDSLDRLLLSLGVPIDFDFLSVDIDGNDYHAWDAIESYRPRLVCIEYNPSIPTEVAFCQPRNPLINQGASLRSLCELAKRKGYELIVALVSNAVFVDGKYYDLFGIPDNSPATLRTDLSFVTWFFTGYDGTIHLAGHKKLHWHRLPIHSSQVQILPGFLRKYPPVYTRLERYAMNALMRYLQWRHRS